MQRWPALHVYRFREVELGEGRRLKPTKLGITLVHGYQVIDNELVIPKVRADIESQCNLIAKGHAKKDEVVEHTLKLFCAKFDYFVAQIEAMDNMFDWAQNKKYAVT